MPLCTTAQRRRAACATVRESSGRSVATKRAPSTGRYDGHLSSRYLNAPCAPLLAIKVTGQPICKALASRGGVVQVRQQHQARTVARTRRLGCGGSRRPRWTTIRLDAKLATASVMRATTLGRHPGCPSERVESSERSWSRSRKCMGANLFVKRQRTSEATTQRR